MKKKILRIVCIMSIMVYMLNYIYAFENYESYEKELQNIKSQLQKTNISLTGIDREINLLLIEICELDQQITKAEEEKAKLDNKEIEIKNEIDNNNSQIEELSQLVETDTLYYEQRLKTIYENGTLDMWHTLCTSNSFMDFLRKYNLVASIIEEDKKLYTRIKTRTQTLATAKQKIEVKNAELESLKIDREDKLSVLLEEKTKREDLIKSFEQDKEKAESQAKLLQAQEDALNTQLEDEIKQLIEKYRIENGSTVSGTPNAAGFVWPVGLDGGTVTAGFPTYPASFGGGKHDGMDIASTNSPPVRACKAGTIIKVISDRPQNTYPYSMQYGNYIIVLHEDGVTTSLYGHLNSVMVKLGDKVETGQQIGVLGNSGYSTGPHLHFEVRVNGIPQQPLNYVNK